MRRFLPVILIALAACVPLGCGGDDESTVTATVTTTPSVTTTETSSTESTTTGKIGPGVTGGEVADLPLCSKAPPPCRGADGSVVEP
jgi:hypothetical protein